MDERNVRLFDQWVRALRGDFAGIHGATHFRLIDGEWTNEKTIAAEDLMRRHGVPGRVLLRNGRYEAWMEAD